MIVNNLLICLTNYCNYYYESKLNSFNNQFNVLKVQLYSIQEDYIKHLYNRTSNYFVEHYSFDGKVYAIPKISEQNFLYDEYGIKRKWKKNVKKEPCNLIGYSYFKFENDSTLVFDYVELDKFRTFIAKDEYQEKFYACFSNNSNLDDIGHRKLTAEEQAELDELNRDNTTEVTNKNNNSLPPPPKDPLHLLNSSDKSKSYSEKIDFSNSPRELNSKWKPPIDAIPLPTYITFDLGTFDEFKTNIKSTDKYLSISKEVYDLRIDIYNSKSNIIDSNGINRFLFNMLIIIVIIFYPLRFSIVAVRWALKTIKQKE